MGASSASGVPLAAFILSVMSGALLLAGGGMMGSMYAFFPGFGMMRGISGGYSGMMGQYFGGNGSFGGWFYVITALGLVAGAMVLVGATMLYSRPEQTSVWGTVILAFSIVGLIGMGGFFAGSILGVIGGVLAIASGKERTGNRVAG